MTFGFQGSQKILFFSCMYCMFRGNQLYTHMVLLCLTQRENLYRMYIMGWGNRVFTALLGDGTQSMSKNISVLNYPTKEI